MEKFFEALVSKFSKKVGSELEEINNLLQEDRFEDAKIALKD
mgnify:CR=1 FL=1